MTRAPTKRIERIEARLQPEKKERIQRAADIEGLSLSDFVVSKASAAAEDVIRAHEVMELNAHDSQLFVEALLNPPESNEHLRAAFRNYQKYFGR